MNTEERIKEHLAACEPIRSFSGKYAFLSNFFIEPDGTHVEGEFQQMKATNLEDSDKFEGLAPAEAKAMGKTIALRENWDEVKIEVMSWLVERKFADNDVMLARLLETGDAPLIEGNRRGDSFWGVTRSGWGEGENHLGQILMSVRDKLRGDKDGNRN